jgi:hypothetical protein
MKNFHFFFMLLVITLNAYGMEKSVDKKETLLNLVKQLQSSEYEKIKIKIINLLNKDSSLIRNNYDQDGDSVLRILLQKSPELIKYLNISDDEKYKIKQSISLKEYHCFLFFFLLFERALNLFMDQDYCTDTISIYQFSIYFIWLAAILTLISDTFRADIERKTYPIIDMAILNNTPAVTKLIKYMKNPLSCKDENGWTVIDWAIYYRNKKILKQFTGTLSDLEVDRFRKKHSYLLNTFNDRSFENCIQCLKDNNPYDYCF